MPSSLEIVQLSDETTVAAFGELLLVDFRGPTLPSCAVPMDKARKLIAGHHPRFSFLGVVRPESPAPDQPARRALLRFFEQSASTLACAVVAFEVEGFRGAMVRTVVSSVFDLMPRSRFSFPRHIVRSVAEAAPLLHQHAPAFAVSEVVSAMSELMAMSAPR